MELSVVQNLAERERANNTKRMAFKEAELTESKASNRELRCRVSALEKRLQSKSSEALSSLDDLRTRLSDVASASKERIGSLQSELSKALEERAALVDDLGRAQDTVQTLEDDKRKLNVSVAFTYSHLCIGGEESGRVRSFIRVCARARARVCVCVRARARVCVCTRARVCVRVHARARVCACTRARLCVCARVCVA